MEDAEVSRGPDSCMRFVHLMWTATKAICTVVTLFNVWEGFLIAKRDTDQLFFLVQDAQSFCYVLAGPFFASQRTLQGRSVD